MQLLKLSSKKFKKLDEIQMQSVNGGRKTYWKVVGDKDGGDGYTYRTWELWEDRWLRADVAVPGTQTFGDVPLRTD